MPPAAARTPAGAPGAPQSPEEIVALVDALTTDVLVTMDTLTGPFEVADFNIWVSLESGSVDWAFPAEASERLAPRASDAQKIAGQATFLAVDPRGLGVEAVIADMAYVLPLLGYTQQVDPGVGLAQQAGEEWIRAGVFVNAQGDILGAIVRQASGEARSVVAVSLVFASRPFDESAFTGAGEEEIRLIIRRGVDGYAASEYFKSSGVCPEIPVGEGYMSLSCGAR